MENIIYILLFLVACVIALCIIVPPYLKNKKSTNGIRNTDTLSRSYSFKVNYSKEEFLRKLESNTKFEDMTSDFDRSKMIIAFSDGVSILYSVNVKDLKDHCLVRLEQQTLIHGRSYIPMHINDYMINQIGAEPVPYDEK